MKKKRLLIGITIVCALLLVAVAVVGLGIKMVQDYHDENTFADLSIVTTKQGCYLDADIYTKDSELFNYPVNSDTIKESFIKGDTFTVDKYEFLVQDVEFEYAEIKIVSGSFFDGNKMLKEGDIITFLIDEKMNVTHRVKEISDKGFITKGDANNTEDAVIVTEKEYVGKVILSISMIGYIFLFIQFVHRIQNFFSA